MSEGTKSPTPSLESSESRDVTRLRVRHVPEGFPATWEEAQKAGYTSKKGWRRARLTAITKERRGELRIREKERKKERKRIAKENGIPLPVKPKKYKMEESSNKQRICIDLDFSSMMNYEDQKGTMNQVNFSYGINRRMENPFQLYFCGLDDVMRKIAEDKRFFNNWDVHIKSEKINELFKPEEIVYLCAESPNLLNEFDDSKVYVIGGLLDHNHYSGHCYDLAVKNNYNHARLPILENNISLSSRTVLTINQVFEILAKISSGKEWKDALSEVIPQRKQACNSNQGNDENEASNKPELVG